MVLEDCTWNRSAHVDVYRNLWPSAPLSEAVIISNEFWYLSPASVESILIEHSIRSKWPAKASDFVDTARYVFKSRARVVSDEVFSLVKTTNGLEFPRRVDLESVFDNYGIAVAWGLLKSFDVMSRPRFVSSVSGIALSRKSGPSKREWLSLVVCAHASHEYRKFYHRFISNPLDVNVYIDMYQDYGGSEFLRGETLNILSGRVSISDISSDPVVNVGVKLPRKRSDQMAIVHVLDR